MSLGQNVRKWRERRLYTQVELARHVGISPNSLYRIEKETFAPKRQTLEKIAKALEVSIELLLDEPEIAQTVEVVTSTQLEENEPSEQPESPEISLAEPESAEPTLLEPLESNQEVAPDVPQLGSLPSQFDKPEKSSGFLKSGPVILPLVLFVIAGLIGWGVIQYQQVQEVRAAQALDQRGLDLLTNSDTLKERMVLVTDPNAKAHGHWYHQKGIDTQLFVIEFMPPLPSGTSYYGWLQDGDGSWHLITRFVLDEQSYARAVLVGSDGSKVQTVIVTKQTESSTTPQGEVVLRYQPGA